MYELNLPQFDFRLKKDGNVVQIFDEIRRKFVKLTPEEWVRQHVVHFLLSYKHFPAALMAVEVGLEVQSMNRRADVVCYGRQGNVLLVVECKAPEVQITQAVFNQIANYNINLKSRYLLVSNGLQHFACKINQEEKSYKFLPEIPDYSSLKDL